MAVDGFAGLPLAGFAVLLASPDAVLALRDLPVAGTGISLPTHHWSALPFTVV